MASWGMLGAGLSAMGDTLGKYAMQRISSDEALAREKSLADYKIEMQEKMDARAAELYAKKVGAARTAAQGSLQGRIDESTRLPGLLAAQAESERVFNRGGPPGGPVIRGGEVTTEMALADLNAADRDIYRRNIEENIAYAKGLKPSASQIEAETYHQLRSTDAETAKKFGTELKNEAEIAKLLRPSDAKDRYAIHAGSDGAVVVLDKLTGDIEVRKVGAAKTKKPSADEEKSRRALDRLNLVQVHDTSGATRKMTREEFATLSSWANRGDAASGKDPLTNAPVWVQGTINGLGGIASTRELLKEAGSQVPTFHTPPKAAQGAGTAAQGSNRDGPWSNYPKK